MTRARFLTLADIHLGVGAFFAHEHGAITTIYHQFWRYYGFTCIPGHSTVPSTLRRAGVYRAAEPDCSTACSIPYPCGRGISFSYPTRTRRVRRLTTIVNGTLSSCIPIPSTMKSNLRRVRLCRAAEADSSMTCAIPNPCRDLSRRRSSCFNSREGRGYDD